MKSGRTPCGGAKRSAPILVMVVVGLFATAVPSLAGATQGWEHGGSERTPTMQSLIPRLDSDESYSERYTFAADLDGGGRVKVEMTISNYGFGDHHGVSSVEVEVPGLTNYDFSKKVGSSDWSYAKDRFRLSIADTTVEGVGEDTFRLKHDGKVDLDLTFENRLPMWSPGRGKITSGGKYFTMDLISPRADVTGTVSAGGKTVDVRGSRSGFADHSATQFAPYSLAERFSRFHDFNDDVFVAWREIKLTEGRGGRSLTWIVVGYRDKIVFSDAGATIKIGDVKYDSETGYRVPKAIQIEAEDGPDRVKFVIRGDKLRRKDLLAEHGAVVKLFASAVTDPYQYALDGNYALEMTIDGTTATVRGNAEFSMDYL